MARVIAVLVGLTAIAGATGFAYASTHHVRRASHATRLAVFAHHLPRAHTAAVSHVPAIAVLAAVAGKDELYAWEGSLSGATTPKNLCIEGMTAAGSAGGGCAPPATVTGRGLVVVGQSDALGVSVVMLLPNGVGHVTVTNRDGTSTDLAVSNNAAETNDADIASLSYTLASGKTVTEDISASATAPGATIN